MKVVHCDVLCQLPTVVACVCLCVCVCERERERERVCVCAKRKHVPMLCVRLVPLLRLFVVHVLTYCILTIIHDHLGMYM